MLRSACLAMLLCTSFASADNWDRFHGPNGAGASHEKNIPVVFDKGSLLWKVKLPGVGNSSPVIWGRNLFVQAAAANGADRKLLCIDTRTGETRWTYQLPGVKAHTHGMNTLASATPAVDGDAIYVPFWNGKDVIVTAISFKGEELWKKNLGPFFSQHGAGASPILYKDKLILANDMDKLDKDKFPVPVKNPSLLVAFDKTNGSVLWEVPREPYRACYSAPFLLEKPGAEPELVVTSTTAITSYHPATGAKNWDWKWDFGGKAPLRTIASTILVDGMLLAAAGDGGGDRHAVGISLKGNGKDAKPTTAWQNKKEFPYVPCLVHQGEQVYFVNDAGFAGCYDAKTGRKHFYVRLPDAKFTASPVLIDAKVYACSEEGDVFVFAAETKYTPLAKNAIGERIRATPAVADGRLFIRGQEHLYCYGKGK